MCNPRVCYQGKEYYFVCLCLQLFSEKKRSVLKFVFFKTGASCIDMGIHDTFEAEFGHLVIDPMQSMYETTTLYWIHYSKLCLRLVLCLVVLHTERLYISYTNKAFTLQ